MATLHFDRLPRTTTPGEVARFVRRAGKLTNQRLGAVTLFGQEARVEVADELAAKLLPLLDGATFRDYPVRVRLGRPMARRGEPASAHFARLAELLALEAIAERERADDPGGGGARLAPVGIRSEDPGLGGRLVLTLSRAAGPTPLPPHRLEPGAPVALTQLKTAKPAVVRGVVSARTDRALLVAVELDSADRPDGASWRVDLAPDDAARERMTAALYRAGGARDDRLAELRDVLLGDKPPRPGAQLAANPHTPLNAPQEAALNFALAAPDLACIHGPPGTGKTTTLVELIRRAVASGERVLACAPSNAAVDNLLEKLVALGLEPVRVGHPARVAEALREHTLDILVEAHPDARQARKFAREAQALFRQADRWTKAKPTPGEKAALRNEARDLLAVARRTEQLAVERVLGQARVVCATLTGVDAGTLGLNRFDLLVIDEACQAVEPAAWIPLARVNRLALAGDPCQLPPTVVSRLADEKGLGVSLMERVMAAHPAISRLLTVQYRMHDAIMTFPSAEFYDSRLEAAESVKLHLLRDLDGVVETDLTTTPLRFLDTAGAGYDEEPGEDGRSRRNPQEAELTATQVRKLLDAGVPAADIAVITPYSGQSRRLAELLVGTGVEVDSVDGFQGREKEAVVISLVRSNPAGEIGFLADVRRTNVALTRARRLALVIGDSATLAGHEFYKRFLDYVEEVGAYRSVWEE